MHDSCRSHLIDLSSGRGGYKVSRIRLLAIPPGNFLSHSKPEVTPFLRINAMKKLPSLPFSRRFSRHDRNSSRSVWSRCERGRKEDVMRCGTVPRDVKCESFWSRTGEGRMKLKRSVCVPCDRDGEFPLLAGLSRVSSLIYISVWTVEKWRVVPFHHWWYAVIIVHHVARFQLFQGFYF